MALQDTLTTADKVETTTDKVTLNRGKWSGSPPSYSLIGTIVREETITTSTWTHATKEACENFKDAYSGEGSIAITQESKQVNSWQLELVEKTKSETFTSAS